MASFSELRAYYELKSKFKRTWTLCMTPADTAAFSNALRAAFPNIRFVSDEYWRHFVDQKRLKDDCWVHARQWAARVEPTPVRYHYVRDLEGQSLHYWDSLTDPAETHYRAWIEPPGWRPQWKPADWQGVRELDNIPNLEFTYSRSFFEIQRRTGGIWSNDEVLAGHNRETVTLHGELFQVRWNRYDEEGEAFGKTVFKILRRLTVDRYIAVERESRKAFTGEPFRHPAWCLVGHDADAWTLKRRHNYLTGSGGPLMKSAAYKFPPKGVFTPAQLARSQAAEDAALEKEVRRQIEEGTHFLVPCGTTGESPTLSEEERTAVVRICVEEARGRIPVLAGAGGYDTREVAHAARLMERDDDIDVRAQLSQVKAPTLVVHCDRDRAVPPEDGRRLAAAIRGAPTASGSAPPRRTATRPPASASADSAPSPTSDTSPSSPRSVHRKQPHHAARIKAWVPASATTSASGRWRSGRASAR